ncbi:MAG: PEP-CTERM sorting domain-containing protein [Acidobacteria bacterium]|nr:PEP-CTERM sorting domain-containing protein [Acidobacteriota bacterium]
MKINHFLAIGAMLVGSTVLATPIGYGSTDVTVNINGVVTTTSINQTTHTGSAEGGNLAINNFKFGMSWDVDPTLTWSYTTTSSGPQTITFSTNIIPDAYNKLFNSAGYTLTGVQKVGNKTSPGATISDVTVKVYIPFMTQYIPEGDVTVKGVSGVRGTLTRSEDNTGFGGVGDYVPFGPSALTDLTMGVEIKFNATLNKGDTLSLNGTLDIQKEAPPVPEPATFGLIGAALVGLGSFARRRA